MNTMKKVKIENASYVLTTTCPKGHLFSYNIDDLEDEIEIYKGHTVDAWYEVYCQECRKNYRLL